MTPMGDLGAAARDWVSERTDYPRHVAQLALAQWSRWRRRQCPLRLAAEEQWASGSEGGNRQRDTNVAHWHVWDMPTSP